MIDTFGRNIHYARISITDLCNLRCQYCMPEEGVTKKDCGEILRIEDYIRIAEALSKLGVDKIRLSGGEPLVRRGVVSLVEELAKLPGIRDLAMTTNGIFLPRLGDSLKQAGLMRLNISIDTLDRNKYREITRGGDLSQALLGFHTALQLGFQRVKVNVVLMKDFTEIEIPDFVDLTMQYPVDVRFIEWMPFVGQEHLAKVRFLSGQTVLDVCKDLKPVPSEDPSAPAKYYMKPGAKGRVGLIEPMSHQFCNECNRLRITADGHLLSCLHSREEVDLRPYLHQDDLLKETIERAIAKKPGTHRLHEGLLMNRDMGKIGG